MGWRQIGTSWLLRLRHGCAAGRRRAGGGRRVPHRGAQLLLPELRRWQGARATVTAPEARPSRDDFHALARDYTVVPVCREVLADLETPMSPFGKPVPDREGCLPESCGHPDAG